MSISAFARNKINLGHGEERTPPALSTAAARNKINSL
jgi:hypothetical protein